MKIGRPSSSSLFLALLAALVSLAGCNETTLGLNPAPSDLEEPVWVRSISHRALDRPLQADGSRVYLSTPAGVAALDRETGELIWEAVNTVGLVGLPYVVVGGVVVVGRGNTLVGLRASDGEVLYERTETATAALVGSEPDGLFATDGETVVSYDPLSGATRWSAPLERGENVQMSARKDLVCVLSVFQLTCYDRSEGSVLWSRFVHPPPWLAVTETRVVVAGLAVREGSGWMGIDPETGEIVWKDSGLADFAQWGRGPAESRQGDVLYACATACVAVRASDGAVLWRTSMGQKTGAPTVGEEFVFVTGFLGEQNPLYVLDATNGVLRDRILPGVSEPRGFCGTPATSGDLLFVFGCFGTLNAYRIR